MQHGDGHEHERGQSPRGRSCLQVTQATETLKGGAAHLALLCVGYAWTRSSCRPPLCAPGGTCASAAASRLAGRTAAGPSYEPPAERRNRAPGKSWSGRGSSHPSRSHPDPEATTTLGMDPCPAISPHPLAPPPRRARKTLCATPALRAGLKNAEAYHRPHRRHGLGLRRAQRRRAQDAARRRPGHGGHHHAHGPFRSLRVLQRLQRRGARVVPRGGDQVRPRRPRFC